MLLYDCPQSLIHYSFSQCDEQLPSCRNCIKHGAQCDTARLPSPRPGHEQITPGSSLAPLNLVDLELFHNFTSATYATISTDPATRNIWKNAIARKATGTDFLMGALLSVSALHLAKHRPERKQHFLSYAIAYHNRASRQAAALMAELLPENLEDLWTFSVLTMYFALGSPTTRTVPFESGDNVLPEWVFLFNGVHHIVNALHTCSYSGMLSPILQHGADRWDASHRPEYESTSTLNELSANIEASVADEELLAIYRHAIRELRFQLNFVLKPLSQCLDIMDVFVWHNAVAGEFMSLLKQGRQEAVAIFAHSLVIFGAVGQSTWLHGWDTVLLSRCYDILDDRHRSWIQWPIEEIGWIPPY